MKHRFYKEPGGQWYIDLPEYLAQGGSKAALQMVAGADTMLDHLSKGGNEVTLQIDTSFFQHYDCSLVKAKESSLDGEWGCDYYAVVPGVRQHADVWLCPVTKFVFDGSYPDVVFIAVTE